MEILIKIFVIVYLGIILRSSLNIFRGKTVAMNREAMRNADDHPREFKVAAYLSTLTILLNFVATMIAFTVPGVPTLALVVIAVLMMHDVNYVRMFLNTINEAARRNPARAASLAMRRFNLKLTNRTGMVVYCRTAAWVTVVVHAFA